MLLAENCTGGVRGCRSPSTGPGAYRLMDYQRFTGGHGGARPAAGRTAERLSRTLRRPARAEPCTHAAAVCDALPGARCVRLPGMPRPDCAWARVLSGLLALASTAAAS